MKRSRKCTACARPRNSSAMAALLLLLPSLLLAVAPAAGQLQRVEIIQDPPPFVPGGPPILVNMVNMMERMMNDLVPQPLIPVIGEPELADGPLVPGPLIPGPAIPGPGNAAAEEASNESRINESAEPQPVDVAIDIKVVPLGGPGSGLGGIILPLPRFQREPVASASKGKDMLRKRHNATKSSAGHAKSGHRKVAMLEVVRANNSHPVLLPVSNSDVNSKKETKDKPSPSPSSSSAASELPSSSKSGLRLRSPAESAQQQLQDEGTPVVAVQADSSVASSRRAPKVAKVSQSALGGVATFGANYTDPTSSSTETGIAAACYALFLRHGLLLLVLAVICGISCLLGALLPIFCRRRRAQVSQYPPKRRFVPARIFADPQMMRMFRRREHMVA
uniref:Mucin n=1 Tax=Rhipicephalus appendiculatus TaxID=34631 RepID=A0A131YFD7_RHIAP